MTACDPRGLWRGMLWASLCLAVAGCTSVAGGRLAPQRAEAGMTAPAEDSAPRGFRAFMGEDGGESFVDLPKGQAGRVLDSQDAAAPTPTPGPDVPKSRRMIYRGQFTLLVANVKEALRTFVSRVEALGGYLERQDDNTVTCRVPAASFQTVVAALPALGAVVREAVQAEDVTKQYFDIELRIATTEKTLARLTVLLDRADKMEDVLAIEREIQRLTAELERLKGELRFLQDQIAQATVEVRFVAAAPPPQAGPGRTPSRFYWLNRVGVEHVLADF